MSNTRKARGMKTPDTGHSWAEKTYTKPLPVRGAWMLPASGPLVWADTSSRLDVRDLARGHREAPEGAVFTQWGPTFSPSQGVQVLLLVRFKKPVRTEFALAFGPGHLEILMDIATAGRVSMVTREPHVSNGVIEVEAYNAVSIGVDRPGLQEILSRISTL